MDERTTTDIRSDLASVAAFFGLTTEDTAGAYIAVASQRLREQEDEIERLRSIPPHPAQAEERGGRMEEQRAKAAAERAQRNSPGAEAPGLF